MRLLDKRKDFVSTVIVDCMTLLTNRDKLIGLWLGGYVFASFKVMQ